MAPGITLERLACKSDIRRLEPNCQATQNSTTLKATLDTVSRDLLIQIKIVIQKEQNIVCEYFRFGLISDATICVEFLIALSSFQVTRTVKLKN